MIKIFENNIDHQNIYCYFGSTF